MLPNIKNVGVQRNGTDPSPGRTRGCPTRLAHDGAAGAAAAPARFYHSHQFCFFNLSNEASTRLHYLTATTGH